MYSVPNSEAVAAQLTSDGYNAPNDLQLSIENLVHTNAQIIAELKNILTTIYEYRKRSNIVKTAGTTVGVGGAVALCAAPFTGGLSASVAIAGIAATGTSAVTSIGSSIAYRMKQRQFTNNLEKLQEQQQLAAQDLTLKLNIINSVVEDIVTSTGLDERTALSSTLYHISRKTIKLVITGYDFVVKDTVVGKRITQQMNRLQELAVGIILTKGVHPKDLMHEISHPVINAAVQFGQAASKEFKEFQVLMKSSAQSVKGVSGRTILHGVGAAVSVIFSVIDVALLIRDWRNPDPLVGTITGTIKDLENDIGKCADILNLLKNIEIESAETTEETEQCDENEQMGTGMESLQLTVEQDLPEEAGHEHGSTTSISSNNETESPQQEPSDSPRPRAV